MAERNRSCGDVVVWAADAPLAGGGILKVIKCGLLFGECCDLDLQARRRETNT